MAISSRFILEQGDVLKSMGKAAFAAWKQSRDGVAKSAPAVPGPKRLATLEPRSRALISAYVRHVGGDAKAYKKTLPPHLFPQWSFGLAASTLEGVPYPLMRVMNGGCRIESRAPLPSDEPLDVAVHLADIDDNGRRAVLRQHVVTGTASSPAALVCDLYAIVPLPQPKGDGAVRPKRAKARVPLEGRELAYWRLRSDAGLDFAKLTGDFNPIHWVPAYAKVSGFRSTILHGFGTLARTWEGLNTALVGPGEQLTCIDVKFTRPLVLPASVGLYVLGDQVFVGDAPGGPAYLTGTFVIEERT